MTFSSLSSRQKSVLILVGIAAIGLALFFLLRPRAVSGVPEQVAAETTVSTSTMAALAPQGAVSEGPLTAKVTVTEFLDYQCEGCAQFQPVMDRIRLAYKGRVRFVIRDFPLVEGHPFSKGAAMAAACAERQGKFFEYSDTLFTNRTKLTRADLEGYATDLGLDGTPFTACLDDASVGDAVMRDRIQGQTLGVRQTPTIFINDAMLSGIPSEEEFRSLIDGALDQK